MERNKKEEHVQFPSEQFNNEELECWMSKLPEAVRNIPLNKLFLPGSHDSFSYSLKWGHIGPDAPSALFSLAKFSGIAKPAIFKWSVTQKSTVYEQLTHGIRYFDIRVAVRNDRFYFVHLLFGEDLELLLMEIRKFLDHQPGEVVLLDFQHFYGLSDDHHLSFISLLMKTFKGLICPIHQSLRPLSLSYLSKYKFQVIIFYRNFVMQRMSGFWPGKSLPNPWPDTVRMPYLMSFLEAQINKKSDQTFFVTQCVLTPTGGYIAKNLMSSLKKKLAVPCNDKILEWVSSSNLEPNVIMTDFVEYQNWAIPKAVIQKNYYLKDRNHTDTDH